MEHWPQIMGEIHADRPKATGRMTPDAVDLDRRLPGNRRAARTNRTPGSGRQTAMPIVLSCENVPDSAAILSENSRFRLEVTRIRLSMRGLCPATAEFLAKLQSNSDPSQVNHFQFFLFCLAG
jgi:hypothetical protein